MMDLKARFFCKLLTIRVLFVLMFYAVVAKAQIGEYPMTLSVQPISLPSSFGGVQSFALATYQGKWLLIGGRTDGLHPRQPFAAFDAAYNNLEIFVIDPAKRTVQKDTVQQLSVTLREQLQSTNTQFIQRGNTLYVTGGYGYSATMGEHTTFPFLTAIRVDSLMWAIEQKKTIQPYFRQYQDSVFALAGGQLGLLDSTFYLVGGHRFGGVYNPIGPENGPGFSQQYSNQVRRFKIRDDGKTMKVYDYHATTDTAAFHRRDYNLLPQIFPGKKYGFTLFSGVFQEDVDLPYLNLVDIFPDTYYIRPEITQYFNQYHTAKLAMYDAETERMENVFFGGIGQFYDSSGVVVQDNNVPFTKYITLFARDANGHVSEKCIGQLPHFLGAGAEFVVNPSLTAFGNNILNKQELPSTDSVLLGYIVGGIRSSEKNIFWENTGEESDAVSQIFAIYLHHNMLPTSKIIHAPKVQSITQLQLFLNFKQSQLQMTYWIAEPLDYCVRLLDAQGKLLAERFVEHSGAGYQKLTFDSALQTGNYLMILDTEREQIIRKVIVVD